MRVLLAFCIFAILLSSFHLFRETRTYDFSHIKDQKQRKKCEIVYDTIKIKFDSDEEEKNTLNQIGCS